jgi:hypothetical protein
MRFPADAGVVDVTKPPYNAKGDGVTDDTAAIQQALTDFAGRGIIYLPNGTYLISDTLRWMRGEKRNILQGQSQAGTIIRIKDNAPGFQDPTQPRPMLWTGRKPAQRFRNGIRNLTLDTGKGNPGAIGAQFIANNQGGIHYVTIRSGDGSGPIGLDLAYTPEEGPFLATYLTIEGFDVGIANSCPVDSVTFENLRLRGQRKLGIDIDSQVINIRKMESDLSVPVIRNYGVAVTTVIESEFRGSGAASEVAAIDNEFVLFLRDVKATGYARLVDNKAGTRVGVAELEVEEYTSHAPTVLFPSPPVSLRLPIKETPTVPWDDPATWTSILDFGPPKMVQLIREGDGKTHMAFDWSEALQKAIDSGATTIYFPNRGADQTSIPTAPPQPDDDEGGGGESEEFPETPGEGGDQIARTPSSDATVEAPVEAKPLTAKQKRKAQEAAAGGAVNSSPDRVTVDGKSVKVAKGNSYGIYGTVYLRNKVRRIIGMEADLDRIVNNTEHRTAYQPELVPKFVLQDGEAPVVVVERFNTWYGAPEFHQASKRALLISSMSFFRVTSEPDSGDIFLHDVRAKHMHAAKGTSIWGRQVNPEGWQEPRILVDGGNYWVLGLKTETDATIGIVKNGGSAEVIGGFFYANKGKISPKTMWVNEESNLSFGYGSWKTKRGKAFDVVVRETRGGVTREVRHEDAIPRGEASALALYTGSLPQGKTVPEKPAGLEAEPQGTSEVILRWNGPVTGADGLAVESRVAGEGEFVMDQVVRATATEAKVSGLKAGAKMEFRVRAFSGAGSSNSDVATAEIPQSLAPGSGSGLLGVYFSDIDFEQVAGERVDPGLDQDGQTAPPFPGIKPERMSVRWTGMVEPRLTETFTFSVHSGSGVRLFVGDQLVVDTLHQPDRHVQSGSVALKAGERVPIRLEMLKRDTPGNIKLSWRSPNTPAEVIPASQLYPSALELPVVGFETTKLQAKESQGTAKVVLKRGGAKLDQPLTVGVRASGDAVAGRDFELPISAVTFPAGESKAVLEVKLKDDKRGAPDRTLVLTVEPAADQLIQAPRVALVIEDDDMPPSGTGTGWQAQFFRGANFETLAGNRVLGRSEFYWDKKAPDSSIDPKEPYSLRLEADLEPLFTEKYQFTLGVGGHGGARLWVNNKLVVDNWEKKGVNSAFVELEAGKRVPVKIEMRQEKFYGAALSLKWSSPSQYLQGVPASQLYPIQPSKE